MHKATRKSSFVRRMRKEGRERKEKSFLYWVSDHQIVFPFHVSILMYILPSVMFVSIIFIILNLEYKCCFYILLKKKIYFQPDMIRKGKFYFKAFLRSCFQVYLWLRLCIMIRGIPNLYDYILLSAFIDNKCKSVNS